MGSIWTEEVSRGFLNFIPTIVKAEDEDGMLEPVKTFMRNPQKDFEVTEFPSVTIFHYDQRFSEDRYAGEHETPVEIDEENKVLVMRKNVLPYDLFFQIDFWSEYQEDMDEMNRRWSGNVGKNFLLPVKDTEGNDWDCVVTQIDFKRNLIVRDKVTIFQHAYSYRVWVELDERPNVTKPMATQVEVHVKPSR